MKNQQQLHLLQKSGELFKKYGVKSYTMDDIARELGISKKTIYQFVENKAELIKLTMEAYLANERHQLEVILKTSKNSVDEMIKMVAYFYNQVRDFNPSALNDLQKYYPETWAIYNHYRFHFMLNMIIKNIDSGIAQQLYRSDVDTGIIARVYIANIDVLINQAIFPSKEYAYIDIYKQYLNYHLRGIVTAKGLKYLEQHNLFTG